MLSTNFPDCIIAITHFIEGFNEETSAIDILYPSVLVQFWQLHFPDSATVLTIESSSSAEMYGMVLVLKI